MSVNALNDLFGFEAAQKRQKESELKLQTEESYFKPWRIFINHIDSYHGKLLTNLLSDTVYVDPQDVRSDPLPAEDDEEFADKDDEYIEEEEREKRKRPNTNAEVSRKYEVIGTVLDRKYMCPEDVTVITRNSNDKDLLLSELMTCGVIIYDITQEPSQIEEARLVLKEIVRELKNIQEKSPKSFMQREPIRHFILISTIMTWALTKPLDPEDPDLPFTEADYRKRRPHPNFKEHIQCEKEIVVVKKNTDIKSKLKTLVICCGITYGEDEGPLHYLFKTAWHNASFLPIFGTGRNKIPLLHIRDLAATVSCILQNWPNISYIVAVEQEIISQNAIVKKISHALTNGNVKGIAREEALLLDEVSQTIYDQMTVDLNIDPVYIIDRIHWHFNAPFQDAIGAIINEYKIARKLHPVKIIILGPPASGKTRVAQYLANHYRIHYVHVKSLISDTIQKLIDDIEVARSGGNRQDEFIDTTRKTEDGDEDKMNEGEEGGEEEEETDEEERKKLEKQLADIRANMAANNGRLDDINLNKLFLNRLKSKDCSNQGYVMDGYPKTLEQARKLFLINEENWEEEEEEFEDEDMEVRNAGMAILPELVVVLKANDEFLKERIMNRPEREIQNTHYTEEHMLRRMKEYRNRNTDDNTPLQLFDEMEIHPLVIPVETDVCPDMFPTIYQCLEKLGKPRNYGPTAEEVEAAQKRAEVERRAVEVAEKLRKERELSECRRKREEKLMEWTNLMEKLKQEEEERLCILAEPLRRYLMKYVFPTLTGALIEVAKLRPEDPVDFLAEYLFKKNPEGKMFEPEYTETMGMLLDIISQQQNDILPKEELEANLAQFLKTRDELSVVGEIEENVKEVVCGEMKEMSIPEGISECNRADDLEGDELKIAEGMTDETGSEV